MRGAPAPPPLDPHLFLRPRPPCSSRLSCDLQAFRLPEFRDPFAFAAAGLVVGLLAVLAWRALEERRSRRSLEPSAAGRPLPVAGPLVVVAALAGYERTGHLVPGLGLAIVLLAAGGLVADVVAGVLRAPLLVRMALAVPGAYVLAEHSALPDPTWAVRLAAAATVVGAALVADVNARGAAVGLGPVLLAVSIVGLYECEPDPDFALLLVGAALPLALLAWPAPLARLGGPGAAAMSGFIAWAAAVGGRGRLSAVVSGIACLGLLAALPLARLLLARRTSLLERLPARWWVALTAGVVQLALVAAATTIAPGRTPARAAEIVVTGLVALTLAACLLSRRRVQPAQAVAGEPALEILAASAASTEASGR